MKKQALLIAIPTACLATTLSAYAQPHDGFYIGARGGVLQSFANASTTSTGSVFTSFDEGTTETLTTNSGNTALGRNFAEGDLFIGYGKQINCTPFYLGGEIFLNQATRENTVKSEAFNINSGADTDDVNATLNSSTKVKLNSFEYGIDFKPGVLINPQTLFYGRIGVSSNKLQITSNSNFVIDDFESGVTSSNPASASSSQHVTGWRFGLGVEEYVCSCLSVTADYIYTTYGGSHNATGSADVLNTAVADVTTSNLTTTGSGKISTQAFLVGIKYTFG